MALPESSALGATEGFGQLPLPEAGPVEALPLQLELIINGVSTGAIVPVIVHDAGFSLNASDLRQANLPIAQTYTDLVETTAFPDMETDYDAPNQRLMLTVPPHWLPHQRLGGRQIVHEAARSSFGALVNYDLYVSDRDGEQANAALWNELRAFGPAGMVSTTGVWQTGRQGTRYRRYDTRFIRSNERRLLTLEAGDLITRGLPWTGAVRLGGFQISRDFAVRPDVVTYPLPIFSGEASLPSTVELFINNHRADAGALAPGPFSLSTLPQVSGAGEASLTVTDALGRRVTKTMSFYVSSALLRGGLTDFAISGGALRQRYGLRNFDYGALAGSASVRHGLTEAFTIEVHAEASGDVANAGVGGVIAAGNAGIFNLAYSRSHWRSQGGGQLSVGYQYQARQVSFSASHVRRDRHFADIGSTRHHDGFWHRLTTATASVSTANLGSVGVAYIDTRTRSERSYRLATASWAVPIGNTARLYMSASRGFSDGKWGATVSISVPLGVRSGTLSGGYVRETDGSNSWRADYSRSVPSPGGLGFNAAVARYRGADLYAQGDVTWRGQHVEARGGVYGTKSDVTRWGSASGSVVVMGGSVFAANRIADAFVLVKTGAPDIPVQFENQTIGRSDARGHILVPWATGYYRARYSIDPLDLPADAATPVVEQVASVTRGGGYVMEFPVVQTRSARITLLDREHSPLPVGTAVSINGTTTTYVGWDGFLFVENANDHNQLSVTLPGGGRCEAAFTPGDLDETASGLLVCR